MNGAWRLAWRNLARNRRRNLATGIAIAVGYAGMVLLGGYVLRVETFLRTNTVYLQRVGHLTIYKRDGLEKASAQPAKYSVSAEEQKKLRALIEQEPGVELVAGYLVGMGLVGNGCKSVPFVGLGEDPAVEERLLTHPNVLASSAELAQPVQGKPLYAYPKVEGAAALSLGLAHSLAKEKVHDELPPDARGPAVPDCQSPDAKRQLGMDANVQLAGLGFGGSLGAMDAEVVNIFNTPLAETQNNALHVPLATLQQLFDTDAVTYLAVFLADHEQARALAPKLERRLRDAGLDVSVYSFEDPAVAPYYVGTVQFLFSLAGFIGLLVAAVSLLSVLNAMTLTLLERTREMGTFRAIGFTRGQLLGVFLREAALLALIAVGAGVTLGLAVAGAVNAANIRFRPPGVPGTIQLLLTPTAGLCVALAAGMVALAALATFLVVRKKTRESVAVLLTEAAA